MMWLAECTNMLVWHKTKAYSMRVKNHWFSINCAGLVLGVGMICSVTPADILAGEQRYVSDRVTLNMYQDTSLSKRLSSLKSGDQVEMLQFDDGYTQVMTEDGRVGWVKSAYLVKAKPAVMKLVELQEELDTLRSRHTDLLIEQTAGPVTHDTGLLSRLEAAESARQNMASRLAELEAERNRHISELRGVKNKTSNQQETRSILLWIILPILTLISGFFLGWRHLESKMRARFGGFNPL